MDKVEDKNVPRYLVYDIIKFEVSICLNLSIYVCLSLSVCVSLSLFGLFSVPTSGPQLVYQRPWYVLFCLWKSAYKRSLAAYRKE